MEAIIILKEKITILNELRRLELLAEKYPTIQSASTELINLQAISNLPKGTEHFVSDLHGEHETFMHIINNASGAIRDKVELLYGTSLSDFERANLSTLIYYPVEKLKEITKEGTNTEKWYRNTLNRLIEICRLVSLKYTRSKVRKALPKDFAYIIEELLHNSYDDPNKSYYYANIIDTIIKINRGDAFIKALCDTIKRLVVDHLHILGDIFDRGPHPDIIMDTILNYHSLDIQWGNHDAVWMGAACGSRACIAVVLSNSITYNNLEFLEQGYGINLRHLALFASETYKNSDVSCFMPKGPNSETLKEKSKIVLAQMNKALNVIRFKLEGQIIKRNPCFLMENRLLLDKINYENKTVKIDNRDYPLKDTDFPTIDKNNPYILSCEENEITQQLKSAFLHSEKFQRHIDFLYKKGSIYKCFNSNLLFHGCIPLNDDGSFASFNDGEQSYSGKDFLDYSETIARNAYYKEEGSKDKQYGKDFLWFLWCGKISPLFGKNKMATFERLLVDDASMGIETKNAYYKYSQDEEFCIKLLKLFSLGKKYSHIINGHMPVKCKDGECSLKANGRLIVIDGGFCKAYQQTTGIAGYTLIYNSYGLKLCSHEPFMGKENAIKNNTDIFWSSVVSERATSRISVGQTDKGKEFLSIIEDLKLLLSAYSLGILKESK